MGKRLRSRKINIAYCCNFHFFARMRFPLASRSLLLWLFGMTGTALADAIVLNNPAGWPAAADSGILVAEALSAAGVSAVGPADALTIGGVIRLDAAHPPAELKIASLSIGGDPSVPSGFLGCLGGAIEVSGDINLGDGAKQTGTIQLHRESHLRWDGTFAMRGSARDKAKTQISLRIVGGQNEVEGNRMEMENAELEFWLGQPHVWEAIARRGNTDGLIRLRGDLVCRGGAKCVVALKDKLEGTMPPAGEYLLVSFAALDGEPPTLELEGISQDNSGRLSLRTDNNGLVLVVGE